MLAAKKAGYDVKLILKMPEGNHAIVIDRIDRIEGAPAGKITKLRDIVVRFFDPAIARMVDMPADEFKKMIATDFSESAMTLFR